MKKPIASLGFYWCSSKSWSFFSQQIKHIADHRQESCSFLFCTVIEHGKSVCSKLGITPKSTHKLRRYYATSMHFSNIPDVVAKDQMRHQDISTTMQSYVFNNSELSERNQLMKEADKYKKAIIEKYNK